MEEFLKILDNMKRSFGLARQGRIFQTVERLYYFDSGTAKVFECQEKELQLLEIILKSESTLDDFKNLEESEYDRAVNNILNLIKEENILQMPFYQSIDSENIVDIIENFTIEHFILELTQNCNLRCRYCIYNETFESFRSFSEKDMAWNTAKNALDFLYEHSSNDVVIGFYGGEPLLNFNLMKQCINYCEQKFKSKNVIYSFTSNLTLLTQDMSDFFDSLNNIQITCSLDGPQLIQDENRVTLTGKGSFEKTIKGLKMLANKFGKENSNKILMVHSVLCPPFDFSKYQSLKSFFESLDWLSNKVDFSYSYPSKGSLPGYDYKKNHNLAGLLAVKEIDPIKYYALNDLLETHNINSYSFKILKNSLIKIHGLEISDEPQINFYRNACCVPGKRKIYVTSMGKFKICERLGETPFIGDVESGIDYETLNNKYLKDYDSYSIEACSKCWAIHMCPMCYAYCYGKNGLEKGRKDEFCQDYKDIGVIDLIIYYYLLEEYPEIQEFLDMLS